MSGRFSYIVNKERLFESCQEHPLAYRPTQNGKIRGHDPPIWRHLSRVFGHA